MKRNYLIGYDISDPKRLIKVAKIMKDYGYRIQYSFFHCWISEAQKKRLMGRIKQAIREKDDQVIIVPVTPEQLKSIEFIGIKEQLEVEGVLIF